MRITVIAAALLAIGARRSDAQQMQAELHSIYQRTNHSHQSAYGGGGEIGVSFGSGPVQLSTDAGLDYQVADDGSQQQLGPSLDVNVLFGGSDAPLTPYLGGSVSENWLSGNGQQFSDGPQLGLEYIVGVSVSVHAPGSPRVSLELRPGYVRTQEHYMSGQLGISTSF